MPRISSRFRPFAPLMMLPAFRPRPAAARQESRPNFVVIVLDDLDSRTAEEMPGLRRLMSEQGRTFSDYFVAVPSCAPSRATLLRGQYAHNHGVRRSNGDMGGYERFHALGREDSTLPVWLQAAGYRTGMFGKYLNGYPGDQDPTYIPPGWDDWRVYSVPIEGKSSRNYYRFTLNENGTLVTYSDRETDYVTDVNARHAVEFIRDAAADGVPFFALLPLRAPHEPAQPAVEDEAAYADATAPRTPSFDEADVSDKPVWIQRTPPASPELIARTDGFQQNRLRTLLSVDRALETLLATLEETGQLANTYLMFTSDNGYHLGEHRQQLEKGTPYEESIRVPFIVRGPGIEAGSVEPRLASGIDIAPTIADLAGAEAPSFVDGRSLRPLFVGEDAPWRDAVLVETWRDPASLVHVEGALQFRIPPDADDEEERDDNPNQPSWNAIRTQSEIYAEYASGEREAYDITADPWQLDNKAGALDPKRLVQLSGHLAELVACAGDACRVADSADAPGRVDPPPMPVILSPQPFTALSWSDPIMLEGAGWDGSGNPLPDSAFTWQIVRHSAKGEQEQAAMLTGARLEFSQAAIPRRHRAFKDLWLGITLTATGPDGRSRSTSIAYGLTTPETGIPERGATPVAPR